jgi:hypothetical protein
VPRLKSCLYFGSCTYRFLYFNFIQAKIDCCFKFSLDPCILQLTLTLGAVEKYLLRILMGQPPKFIFRTFFIQIEPVPVPIPASEIPIRKPETSFYILYFIKHAFKGIVRRLSHECVVKSQENPVFAWFIDTHRVGTYPSCFTLNCPFISSQTSI